MPMPAAICHLRAYYFAEDDTILFRRRYLPAFFAYYFDTDDYFSPLRCR